MSIDASGIEYASGLGGVVSPNDPIETIHDAAVAYRTEWLVLERDSIVGALGPILTGQSRPSWIGAPILRIPAADGGAPRAAVYPICLSPADSRCAVVGLRVRGPALSRREAAASALIVFAIAVLVRVYAASLVVFPKPEDTAYYVDVARNLLAGRGLVSDALWSYQTQPLVVPREAFEVWLPLPTFAAVIPMALLGSTFAAAQVSSILIGALVPVLAWRLAADVAVERGLPPGRARTLAIGTGLTAAVSSAADPPLDPARFDDAVRRAQPRRPASS